ncbi:MAG: class I SAM-dependent methyltransferase [Deltaproteobacteria bacterium]|nr:class I SAM-dependent methyltransferase [Deltaproteobacteria bacterium]
MYFKNANQGTVRSESKLVSEMKLLEKKARAEAKSVANQSKSTITITAKNADRFALYEKAVQAPKAEIHFINRIFRKTNAHIPLILREDFCGTALLCSEWVKSRSDRRAIGRDLDKPTLDYGKRTHLAKLSNDAAARVRLTCCNVLAKAEVTVDVVAAFNFSYCVFKKRSVMLQYFKQTRLALKKGGAFVLDIYGGTDSHKKLIETKRIKGATYVWDQRVYDAISGEALRYIHFRFKDGSEIKRVFTYDWRIWSLPELKDLLKEAGFSQIDVYWEGSDAKGGGNGIFKKVNKAANEQAWIAYIVAWW